MSMPRAKEVLLMNLAGTLEAISGSSLPKPRLKRISSGSSSYRSNSSDTLWTHTHMQAVSNSVIEFVSQLAGELVCWLV